MSRPEPHRLETAAENRYAQQIQGYISRMPSLSTTATKVLEICNRPDVSPHDLHQAISLDPVLTAKVLRLVNSAYYSLRQPVASLVRAIILLGLNTVKHVVLSTAVLAQFGSRERFRAFSMMDFWSHCLCVAVTAKCLAQRLGVAAHGREEYFVAGLLHDLGKIPLNKQFPEEYGAAAELVKARRATLEAAEMSVFGIDHCDVARLIAEKWRLGDPLFASMVNHHQPDRAGIDERFFVSLVAVANWLANRFQIGTSGDSGDDACGISATLAEFDLAADSLPELQRTVEVEIDKAKVFLEISCG
jgi:putative nucleotidyltransferase with HDIG domain